MGTPKFHTLKVSDIRQETEDTVSVAFEVPKGLQEDYDFIQGQYLTLRSSINGEDVRRSYSICSGRGDGELRVAIKKVPGGLFSTFANERLQSGQSLDVMTPMGKFYTPFQSTNKKHYVGFAAGSGITPFMSMIKTMLNEEPESEFTLFYNNKNFASIIFREELQDLRDKYLDRLHVFHLLTREPNEIKLFSGRINAEKCEQLFDKLIDLSRCDEFFMCGPVEMIDGVRTTLEAKNVNKENIHFELFTSPLDGKKVIKEAAPIKEEYKGKVSEVTVLLDGNYIQFDLPYDGENILDAAMAKGADLPFSCKGGVCCTCRAKLQEGAVDMTINYALEPEEVEAGFILTCQSHPTTDKVLVNFDEQ